MPDRYPVSVDTRAPRGETNAYVLADAVLVDPAGRTPALDAAAESVDHVAVTHAHPDHVGAVAAYARDSDATVWAHAAFADRFERETGVAPDRVFRPGDRIGDTGVAVLGTPGHAPDHVAFAAGGEAVVGDLAFADGSVFVGDRDGDLRAYLCSLRRLALREFEYIHPGHGPRIDAPRGRLHELYFHRRDRERRVLAAVADGRETVDGILEHAYDKDLAGVRDLAASAVRAHLEKLAVEGRVTWDGDRATPGNP
ncbi:MAG: MBL fold metallo-hydrolase [Halobacterium sp.]